jgi:small subunit ribosomal protein S9
MEVVNTLGRRKNAVARVYISEGKGNVTINKRDLKEYFPQGTLQYIVMQPLNLIGVADQYDIKVNLDGGGIKGQAEALRLAISRAFCRAASARCCSCWESFCSAALFVAFAT